jgi:pimeloyl-ACP methyl ester carboxylesterase
MTAPIASAGAASRLSPKSPSPDPSLHLSRILCLHGGGTNSRIFRAQCRVLRSHLASSFRLIFADAPFLSPPGPDVESVYAEWGPFRSWLQVFAQLDVTKSVVEGIDTSIAAAICEDDRLGATGAVVGLLGFSQGARIAASLLLRQQNQNRHWNQWNGSEKRVMDPRFAVLLAGRGPLLWLDPDPNPDAEINHEWRAAVVSVPTIHVHGLRDAGIEVHRELLYKCCQKGSTRLVEWEGDHRVPIKTKDVAAVVAEVMQVASNTGVTNTGVTNTGVTNTGVIL